MHGCNAAIWARAGATLRNRKRLGERLRLPTGVRWTLDRSCAVLRREDIVVNLSDYVLERLHEDDNSSCTAAARKVRIRVRLAGQYSGVAERHRAVRDSQSRRVICRR